MQRESGKNWNVVKVVKQISNGYSYNVNFASVTLFIYSIILSNLPYLTLILPYLSYQPSFVDYEVTF